MTAILVVVVVTALGCTTSPTRHVWGPTCFEAFAAGRHLAASAIRNRVRASRSGAAILFRAVLADGSRVSGMVFPGELIWDDDPPPRANAEPVRKSR